MNIRFWTWVAIALINLFAVVMNMYLAIVTGSSVNAFFVVLNSVVFGYCVFSAANASDWEE